MFDRSRHSLCEYLCFRVFLQANLLNTKWVQINNTNQLKVKNKWITTQLNTNQPIEHVHKQIALKLQSDLIIMIREDPLHCIVVIMNFYTNVMWNVKAEDYGATEWHEEVLSLRIPLKRAVLLTSFREDIYQMLSHISGSSNTNVFLWTGSPSTNPNVNITLPEHMTPVHIHVYSISTLLKPTSSKVGTNTFSSLKTLIWTFISTKICIYCMYGQNILLMCSSSTVFQQDYNRFRATSRISECKQLKVLLA